jgi:hypothetical protein
VDFLLKKWEAALQRACWRPTRGPVRVIFIYYHDGDVFDSYPVTQGPKLYAVRLAWEQNKKSLFQSPGVEVPGAWCRLISRARRISNRLNLVLQPNVLFCARFSICPRDQCEPEYRTEQRRGAAYIQRPWLSGRRLFPPPRSMPSARAGRTRSAHLATQRHADRRCVWSARRQPPVELEVRHGYVTGF